MKQAPQLRPWRVQRIQVLQSLRLQVNYQMLQRLRSQINRALKVPLYNRKILVRCLRGQLAQRLPL